MLLPAILAVWSARSLRTPVAFPDVLGLRTELVRMVTLSESCLIECQCLMPFYSGGFADHIRDGKRYIRPG